MSYEEKILLDKIKALETTNYMLTEDVKLLNSQLELARLWLIDCLEDNQNYSEFETYMKEEFGYERI